MKKWMRVFLLLLGILGLTGCRQRTQEEESGYKIWYINQDESKLDYEYRELQAANTDGQIKELLEMVREAPESEKLKPVLPEDVRVEGCDLENQQLSLNFSTEYQNMQKVCEVLCRAALVRTFCQLPDVEYVEFRIEGEPLMDTYGRNIGMMNEDQFIENPGEEINSYKTADLTLYFANKAGDKLVGQRVAMEYNSNISLEKLIVEQLIAGPPFEGAYPTIPSETKLLNISIKDNICYVNLDEGFLGTGYNVIESIPVYSIVNSLIENTDAQKVQISINGETNRMFRESINFDTIFEKNEGLIEQ